MLYWKAYNGIFMGNETINNKMKEKANLYGFELKDLTQNERDELEKEVKLEMSGYSLMDSILSSISPYRNMETGN